MRTRSETDPRLSTLLDTAVERGIIDAERRDRLSALASELGARERTAADDAQPRGEVRGGFNAITVAYSLGAMLVLVALAWFLFDRWSALGAVGVLLVAGLYAVAFAVVAVALGRRGFRIAGGLAAMLAVAMTPVWGWAVLRLVGLWPDPFAGYDPLAREPHIASRLVMLEVATIGIALATVWRTRFVGLGAVLAVAFVALLIHLGKALGDPRLTWYVGAYYQLVVACLTLAIAYAVDRRQPRGEDYALWFYLAGVVMLFAGYVQAWDTIGAWRHAVPLVALSLVTASLYLRRRTLVIAGGVAAFGYLGYLAFDVFRRVVALPVALAALGLLVIVTTVWMQRRFPTLVARVSREDDSGANALPAGPIAVLGPLAIAVTAMGFAVGEAEQRTAEREWRTEYYGRRVRRQTQPPAQPAVPALPPTDSPVAGSPPRR